MDLSRVAYSLELKITAMRAGCGSTTTEIARKYQLSPKLLERWRGEWRAKGEAAFPGIGRRGADLACSRRAGALLSWSARSASSRWRMIFYKSLTAFQGVSPASRRQWRGCLFEEIRGAAKEGKAVTALCAMAGLNRAGFYRWQLPRQGIPVEMELRDEMQKIALESPSYGYRFITAELRRLHIASDSYSFACQQLMHIRYIIAWNKAFEIVLIFCRLSLKLPLLRSAATSSG